MMKYEIYNSKYLGIEPEPVNKKFVKMDMIMQEGYGYEMQGNDQKAIICWNKVYDELKRYFKEHDLKRLKDFDEIYNGTQYVSNWVQDYDMAVRRVLVGAKEEAKEYLVY